MSSLLEGAEVIQSDVLVLGGGIAGCLAAVEAKNRPVDVVLVDKGQVGRSGNSPMMSGVLSVFDPEEDDYDAWLRRCFEVGQYLNEQDILGQVIHETARVVRDLRSWGVDFVMKDGKLERYGSIAGAVNAKMANGGIQLMDVVRGEALRRGVRLVERVVVVDLLTSDGEQPTRGTVVGALGFNLRTGKPYVFKAKATVLGTGIVAPRRTGCTSPFLFTADALMAAWRVGCQFKNLELTQAASAPADFNVAPAAHLVLGQGAYLLNAKGERFMERYDPVRKERAPRDVVGIAVAREYHEGRGPVVVDARHFGTETLAAVRRGIPIYMRMLDKAGLSLAKDVIPYKNSVSPCMGAGGVRIDIGRASTVPGLYAAGSSADHAEDGADNGISHGIEAAVAGKIAGRSAAEYVAEAGEPAVNEGQVQMLADRMFRPMKTSRTMAPAAMSEEVGRVWERVEVVRDAGSLSSAMERFKEIETEVAPALGAGDYHELAVALGVASKASFLELLCRCAVMRTESRGGHFRLDYPEQEDHNWLKWTICQQATEGTRLWTEDVPFDRYPLKPPTNG